MTVTTNHHAVVTAARVPIALLMALSCLPLTNVSAQVPVELADPEPLIEAEPGRIDRCPHRRTHPQHF